MATTRSQISAYNSGTTRIPGHSRHFKRRMNKLYRQAWRQRNVCLFKHPYYGWG